MYIHAEKRYGYTIEGDRGLKTCGRMSSNTAKLPQVIADGPFTNVAVVHGVPETVKILTRARKGRVKKLKINGSGK
jgi:hypothetical protein